MEQKTKRYAALAMDKTSMAVVVFVATADDYKTAWQNARSDCRFGRTVTRVDTGETFTLTPNHIVRAVETLEKRQKKIPEPTFAAVLERADRDGLAVSKPARAALETARAALIAELSATSGDADGGDADGGDAEPPTD